MKKLMKLDLQNAEILNEKEMKTIAGGENDWTCASSRECGNYICLNGTCKPDPLAPPKIAACEGKKPNDPCTVTLQGRRYFCKCISFNLNDPLHCNTLPIFCR